MERVSIACHKEVGCLSLVEVNIDLISRIQDRHDKIRSRATFISRMHLMNNVVQTPQFNIEALQNGDRAEFARLVESFSGINSWD